jgi:hypothetical protein
MKTIMNSEDLTTIDQLTAFLEGTQRVAFEVASNKDSRYQWVQRTLVKFHYLSLSKQDKGVLIRYLMKVSGYSRQQITRLVKQYRDTGRLVRQQRTANGFSRRFTTKQPPASAGGCLVSDSRGRYACALHPVPHPHGYWQSKPLRDTTGSAGAFLVMGLCLQRHQFQARQGLSLSPKDCFLSSQNLLNNEQLAKLPR